MRRACRPHSGSVLFKDYYPDRDAFVVDKLKKAGAIILAKATLGELGGGDTHGSLFGSTKNPYDSGAHGRRLFRRVRGERVGQFLHRRGRSGRVRFDSSSFDLELCRRHASDRGPGESLRRVRRLALG